MENNNIEDLEGKLDSLKKEARNAWANKVNLPENQTLRINDKFISYEALNIEDLKNVLNGLEPYKTSFEKEYGNKKYYISSAYEITIKNNYYNRELRISFKLINDVMIWVTIKINNLPKDFVNKYLVKETRKLYSTESHYVNILFNNKEFKDIKIESYNFKNGDYLSYYGGDKVLICYDIIRQIINEIKENKI